MRTHQISRIFLVLPVLLASLAQQASSQTAVQRRLSLDTLQRHSTLESHAPMFAGPNRTRAYFDEYGIWILSAGTGAAFDSNAFQDATGLHDWTWNHDASLTYEWWASEPLGIVITPAIGIEGGRYEKFGELNGDLLSSEVAFTFKKAPLSPELSYGAGWGFEGGFSRHAYTEQALGVAVGGTFFGGDDEEGSALGWKLEAACVIANPDESSKGLGALGLEYVNPLSDRLTLNLAAGMAYADFYEDSAAGHSQWLASVSAESAMALTKKLSLVTGIAYVHSEDNQPGRDFDQMLASIALRLDWEGFRFLGLPSARAASSGEK